VLPEVRGGRVQVGCDDATTVQGLQTRRVVDGGGFEARRDTTFGMVENDVQSSGNLFYTGKLDLSKCSHDQLSIVQGEQFMFLITSV